MIASALVNSSLKSRFDKATFGAGALGAAILSLQAAAPLEGTPSAPAWLNWLFYGLFMLSLALFLREGKKDERVAAGFSLVAGASLPLVTGIADAESAMELSSLLSRFLSASYGGLPLAGLIYCGSLAFVGFCSAHALVRATNDDAKWVKIAAGFAGTTIAVFGVRALIGYVTGSTTFLAG